MELLRQILVPATKQNTKPLLSTPISLYSDQKFLKVILHFRELYRKERHFLKQTEHVYRGVPLESP